MPQHNRNPRKQVADLWALSDLCTPWCIHVAATLRIAEHIAAGATASRSSPRGGRLRSLRLYVARTTGQQRRVRGTEPGRFALNDAARGLLDPGLRLGLDLDGIGGRMAHAWGTPARLRPHRGARLPRVFGRPFWEDLDAHPEVAGELRRPDRPGRPRRSRPASSTSRGGWDRCAPWWTSAAAPGRCSPKSCAPTRKSTARWSTCPAPCPRRARRFARPASPGGSQPWGRASSSRCPPAPTSICCSVLNDWPDPEAMAILKRCAEAARPGGRVVVLKSVGPDESPRRLVIEMVLVGGKHRGVAEFRKLAQQSGLEVVAAGQQSGYFVVECRPAQG